MNINYEFIINNICRVNNIEENDMIDMLRKKENKYLLLLMLKKYKMFDKDKVKSLIAVETNRGVNYNIKKAEEKFMINRDFREKYIEIEGRIEKNI